MKKKYTRLRWKLPDCASRFPSDGRYLETGRQRGGDDEKTPVYSGDAVWSMTSRGEYREGVLGSMLGVEGAIREGGTAIIVPIIQCIILICA